MNSVLKIERLVESGVIKSLVEKTQPVRMVEFHVPLKDAEKWFALGVQKNNAFEASIKQARRDAVDAAFGFLRARAAFDSSDRGDWGFFLEGRKDLISRSTVYFYIQLARHAMDWVIRENPDKIPQSVEEVVSKARDMILHSVKPLNELCRDLKVFRKFGQYDEIEHHLKTQAIEEAGEQFEFKFELHPIYSALERLANFSSGKYLFTYPEGVDQKEYDAALEKKLEEALQAVRQRKNTITI